MEQAQQCQVPESNMLIIYTVHVTQSSQRCNTTIQNGSLSTVQKCHKYISTVLVTAKINNIVLTTVISHKYTESNVIQTFYVKSCHLMYLYSLRTNWKMNDSETYVSKRPANLICSTFPKECTDLPFLSKYFQRIY